MIPSLAAYSITVCVILPILSVDSLIRRRHYHDGILYENFSPDGNNVRFSDTVGQWNDLDKLVKSENLTRKAMFCSRGAGVWLFYPESNYGYGHKSRELTITFDESCLPVDNMNSIQPLGPLNFKLSTMFTAVGFTEKYFASPGKVLDGKSETIKSVIFMGDGYWTVSGGSQTWCVTSDASPGSVCLVEDAETAFGGTALTITEQCDKREDRTDYGLLSCYSSGTTKIVYAFDFLLPSMQKICSGGYEKQDEIKDKFLNVMDVIDKRLRDELSTEELIDDTMDKNSTIIPLNTFRSSILTKIFKIMASCSGVDLTFLEIVMYIFRKMHLHSGYVWGEPPDQNSTEYEDLYEELENADNFLKSCAKGRKEEPMFTLGCTPMDISAMKSADEIDTIEEFLNGESYDFIIEQIWLMMNYANAYCNLIVGHVDNEWIDFPIIIKAEFMSPIKDRWKNPGRWAHYYPLMFNGYDLKVQKKQMIACLQKAIISTPYYDPISRPPEFYSDTNNTALKNELGKPKAPGGEPPKPEEGGRRKRQRHVSEEKEEAKLVEENKLGGNNRQNNPSSTTTKATIATFASVTTTTAKSSTIESPSQTSPSVAQTTLVPEISKTKPKGRKRGKKEKKTKRGKGKKKGKRSKLLRKTANEPNAEEPVEGVTENV